MTETPQEPGVEQEEAAAPEETRAQRRRARKPKTPEAQATVDWSEKVKVRNLTNRPIHAPSGSIQPHLEGEMSRLDADRLAAYVELVDG